MVRNAARDDVPEDSIAMMANDKMIPFWFCGPRTTVNIGGNNDGKILTPQLTRALPNDSNSGVVTSVIDDQNREFENAYPIPSSKTISPGVPTGPDSDEAVKSLEEGTPSVDVRL